MTNVDTIHAVQICRIEVDEVERSELSASLTCLLTVKFLVLAADVREVDVCLARLGVCLMTVPSVLLISIPAAVKPCAR